MQHIQERKLIKHINLRALIDIKKENKILIYILKSIEKKEVKCRLITLINIISAKIDITFAKMSCNDRLMK